MFKEVEISNPLYIAKIENGVVLYVYDGYAEGDDGKIYKPVMQETVDDECELVGWVCQ